MKPRDEFFNAYEATAAQDAMEKMLKAQLLEIKKSAAKESKTQLAETKESADEEPRAGYFKFDANWCVILDPFEDVLLEKHVSMAQVMFVRYIPTQPLLELASALFVLTKDKGWITCSGIESAEDLVLEQKTTAIQNDSAIKSLKESFKKAQFNDAHFQSAKSIREKYPTLFKHLAPSETPLLFESFIKYKTTNKVYSLFGHRIWEGAPMTQRALFCAAAVLLTGRSTPHQKAECHHYLMAYSSNLKYQKLAKGLLALSDKLEKSDNETLARIRKHPWEYLKSEIEDAGTLEDKAMRENREACKKAWGKAIKHDDFLQLLKTEMESPRQEIPEETATQKLELK